MKLVTGAARQMGRFLRSILFITALAATTVGQAAAADAVPVAETLGVAGRDFTPDDLDQIADLGLSFVRVDLSWARTEKAPGVYDFSHFKQLADQLAARKLRPIFILDYGNPVHTPVLTVERRGKPERRNSPPVTDAQIAAFSRWAAAAAVTFAPYRPIWELWNEPDLKRFWPPEPDPKAYAALVRATCQAMRAVGPVTLYGPAAAKWTDAPFMTALLREDAVRCFDRISVHPYQMTGRADHDANLWNGFRAELRSNWRVRSTPVANTEWGRSVVGRTTQAAQARYLVRSAVSALSAGVAPNIWYAWRDKGNDPNDDQHNFGLLRANGEAKLALRALRVFIAEVGKSSYQCKITAPDVEGAIFIGPAKRAATAVVWAKHGHRETPVANIGFADWKIDRVTDLNGVSVTGAPGAELGTDPVYLRLSPKVGYRTPSSCVLRG